MRGYAPAVALLVGALATAEFACRRRFESRFADLTRRPKESHPGVPVRVDVARVEGIRASPSLAVPGSGAPLREGPCPRMAARRP